MEKTLTEAEKRRRKQQKQQEEEQKIEHELHEIEDGEKEKEAKDIDKPKEGEQILKEQIRTSLLEYQRHNRALFTSSFSAGLEVGFSVLLMGTLYTMFGEQFSAAKMDFVLALAYPIGFIFVIIGRSELFTEHTTLAVLPVLNGTVRVGTLARLWAIVFLGNLLGGYLFGFILVHVGPEMGTISGDALVHLAHHMTKHSWWLTLSSGVLAGWLMGLLSWLVTSSRDTISRILAIILVTSVIGLGGLHHSIVGSIEVFVGLISSPEITLGNYLSFQSGATLGNIIGGTVFVAAIKYGQLGDKTFASRRQ